MAGGFSLLKSNIAKLEKYLDISVKNKIKNNNIYISKNSLTFINENLLNDLKQLSPFGNMNKSPIFFFEKIKIIKTKIINSKHVFFIAKSGSKSCEGIAFNSAQTEIGNILRFYKNEISIISELKESNYKNKLKLQIILKDIIY